MLRCRMQEWTPACGAPGVGPRGCEVAEVVMDVGSAIQPESLNFAPEIVPEGGLRLREEIGFM